MSLILDLLTGNLEAVLGIVGIVAAFFGMRWKFKADGRAEERQRQMQDAYQTEQEMRDANADARADGPASKRMRDARF